MSLMDNIIQLLIEKTFENEEEITIDNLYDLGYSEYGLTREEVASGLLTRLSGALHFFPFDEWEEEYKDEILREIREVFKNYVTIESYNDLNSINWMHYPYELLSQVNKILQYYGSENLFLSQWKEN
jgi:hypothetical protein